MSKVFIDTNIFIRFIIKDDTKKLEDCSRLFERIEEGKIRPYTSNIVILEIQFVLIKIYKFSKNQALEDINTLLSLRNLTIIDKTNTKIALDLYRKNNIKYVDCLIATQIPKGTKLVTYDEEFSKLKIAISTPTDFS